MASAEWTSSAISDLENILFYIAAYDGRQSVAQTIGKTIQEKCNVYAEQPLMGQARPELGKEIRAFPYKRWIIIYRPNHDGIQVLAVIDAARDYAALFKE